MADSLICSVAECGKTVNARGYCKSHYKKLIKYGGPLVTKKVARDRRGPNHCGRARCQAAITLSNHIRYVKNPEPIKRKSKEWKAANLERERQLTNKRRAANPEPTRKKNAEWRAANRKLSRELISNWHAANPERAASYRAKRNAIKKKAMPPWLTENHISQINLVYAEAKHLEKETGIAYEVDHIVPLAADKNVCGLHVPWNLRAIPKSENRRRPRICRDGMY
jgi:hypothetical protein